MENINYKIAGLRDTVTKIKKEIKSFEENETKNIQNRTSTITNKLFRPSINYKKASHNKLTKRLMKKYFKLSLKEQNKNSFQNIMTPSPFNKCYKNANAGRAKVIRSMQNSKKRIYNKYMINDRGSMSNANSFYRKKNTLMTDISNNRMISYYDNEEENGSYMNKNLINFLTTRNKDFMRRKKHIVDVGDKNEQFDKVIMTFSNDLRKSIFNNQYLKNKILNKENKKLLYNAYNNNINTNNNEYYFKNMNNSTYLNLNRSNKENRDININNISDLYDIDNIDLKDIKEQYQYHSNKNIINKNLFKFNTKKNINKNINKNNSYNGRLQSIPNLNQINTCIKKTNKKPTLNYIQNDFHCTSHKNNLINNQDNYAPTNYLYKFQNNFHKDSASIQEYLNYGEKLQNLPVNNTINYLSNNDNIDLYFKNKEKKSLNKNDNNNNNKIMKTIIGNYSIGDLYIKAKLFEKCGTNQFDQFVINNCDNTNDLLHNLKEYKNYLVHIKEEENFYKRQINMYQKLCKENLELLNPKQINAIINELKDNFIENVETDGYIIEQIKSILPYKY